MNQKKINKRFESKQDSEFYFSNNKSKYNFRPACKPCTCDIAFFDYTKKPKKHSKRKNISRLTWLLKTVVNNFEAKRLIEKFRSLKTS